MNPEFVQCFDEGSCPAAATKASLQVNAAFFEDLHKKMIVQQKWTPRHPNWMRAVRYTVMGHSSDATRGDVSIYYVGDDMAKVRCVRDRFVFGPLEFGDVIVWRSYEASARPPESGTHYKNIRIALSREFSRESVAAKGVTWCLELETRWSGRSCKVCYEAPPQYWITLSVRCETSVSAEWLAENACVKFKEWIGKDIGRVAPVVPTAAPEDVPLEDGEIYEEDD